MAIPVRFGTVRRMKSLIFLFFPFLMNAHASSADTPVYQLLSERRAAIALPEYSVEQKQLISKQASFLIDNFYVHRELKEHAFHVNPIQDLKSVEENASMLSSSHLHAKLEDIFSGLRDLHTNYIYPAPFQCYASFLPFSLSFMDDGKGGT